MRYVRLFLLQNKQNGTDMLGNPVTSLMPEETPYTARPSGRYELLQELDGRWLTRDPPGLWTNAPPDKLKAADGIRIENADFRILEVYGNLRGGWSLVTLERWRNA